MWYCQNSKFNFSFGRPLQCAVREYRQTLPAYCIEDRRKRRSKSENRRTLKKLLSLQSDRTLTNFDETQIADINPKRGRPWTAMWECGSIGQPYFHGTEFVFVVVVKALNLALTRMETDRGQNQWVVGRSVERVSPNPIDNRMDTNHKSTMIKQSTFHDIRLDGPIRIPIKPQPTTTNERNVDRACRCPIWLSPMSEFRAGNDSTTYVHVMNVAEPSYLCDGVLVEDFLVEQSQYFSPLVA